MSTLNITDPACIRELHLIELDTLTRDLLSIQSQATDWISPDVLSFELRDNFVFKSKLCLDNCWYLPDTKIEKNKSTEISQNLPAHKCFISS